MHAPTKRERRHWDTRGAQTSVNLTISIAVGSCDVPVESSVSSTSQTASIWTHFEGFHGTVGRRLRVHQKSFVSSSLFQSALRLIPEAAWEALQRNLGNFETKTLILTHFPSPALNTFPGGPTAPSGQAIESYVAGGLADGDPEPERHKSSDARRRWQAGRV